MKTTPLLTSDTIDPWAAQAAVRLHRDRRLEQERRPSLRDTYGKRSRPTLEPVPQAWADTPTRMVIGALLLAAASVAWLVVP